MRRSYKIMLSLVICLAALGLFFQQQIRLFFFHPEGLSMAAAEICLTNQSTTAIVAEIEVDHGAKTITFLTPGENACSASPDPSFSGRVVVSVEEGVPPVCSLELEEAGSVALKKFSAPDNCEWSS